MCVCVCVCGCVGVREREREREIGNFVCNNYTLPLSVGNLIIYSLQFHEQIIVIASGVIVLAWLKIEKEEDEVKEKERKIFS